MTSPVTIAYPSDSTLPAGYVHGDIVTLTLTNLPETAPNHYNNVYTYMGQYYEGDGGYAQTGGATTAVSGTLTIDRVKGTVTGSLNSSLGALGYTFTPYNAFPGVTSSSGFQQSSSGFSSYEDELFLNDPSRPLGGVDANGATVSIAFQGGSATSVTVGLFMASSDVTVAGGTDDSAAPGTLEAADGYAFTSGPINITAGSPVVGGTAAQTTNAGVAINPFPAVTVTDSVATGETVTISFAAANGALSGGGFTGSGGVYTVQATSAAAAQADLRAAVFTPIAGQSATTTFTVSVADGLATATDATTSVIAAYTAPVAGGGSAGGAGGGSGSGGSAGSGGGASSSPPSITTGFSTVDTPNVLRASSNGADAMTPGTPIYAQEHASKMITAQLDNGQMTQAQAEAALAHVVDGTTSVAIADYAFFTGFTPTAAGLDYLVHSAANPTDLNDPYYAQFSTENRYINFAVNLATGSGAGAASFQAVYGSLSLSDATSKAYLAVFGTAPDATKVAALLNTLVPDGLGGQETRATYFAQYGGDGPNGQGTKAAMIGFLLANAVETSAGVYGVATEHYLAALAHGTAPAFGSELALTYGAAVNLVGFTPTPDPTVTG